MYLLAGSNHFIICNTEKFNAFTPFAAFCSILITDMTAVVKTCSAAVDIGDFCFDKISHDRMKVSQRFCALFVFYKVCTAAENRSYLSTSFLIRIVSHFFFFFANLHVFFTEFDMFNPVVFSCLGSCYQKWSQVT